MVGFSCPKSGNSLIFETIETVHVAMGTAEVAGRWGSWEELLLGGAVLRHGTRDWDLVAAELRTRTASMFEFSPEVCKAKYEDLQHRFSGCKAWFEELRKKRMAELKRALEKSEDSIGSLESKLESMISERRNDSNAGYDSSRTESPITSVKYEGIESSSKDTIKDGLSAGSFTQNAETKWPPESQIPAIPSEEMDPEPEVSQSCEIKRLSSGGAIIPSFRKRRGKRKRKYISKDVRESSIGESQMPGSVSTSVSIPTSADDAARVTKPSTKDGRDVSLSKDMMKKLMVIFNSISENQCASLFSRRLDSQKRGRYKKIVRRHMDFDTIRLRIGSRSIKSVGELFRDMLLVANNALVFYSKSTREFKSALLLRHTITNTLRKPSKYNEVAAVTLSSSPVKDKQNATSPNLPSHRQQKPIMNAGDGGGGGLPRVEAAAATASPSSTESMAHTHTGFGAGKNVEARGRGRGRGSQISQVSPRGRKRIRTR